jgi:hypothetical protein
MVLPETVKIITIEYQITSHSSRTSKSDLAFTFIAGVYHAVMAESARQACLALYIWTRQCSSYHV